MKVKLPDMITWDVRLVYCYACAHSCMLGYTCRAMWIGQHSFISGNGCLVLELSQLTLQKQTTSSYP